MKDFAKTHWGSCNNRHKTWRQSVTSHRHDYQTSVCLCSALTLPSHLSSHPVKKWFKSTFPRWPITRPYILRPCYYQRLP